MSMNGNIYYLQYAVYVNYDVMEDTIKKLDNYFIYQDDGKYYVYVGAFVNLENAQKMQKIFEEQNIYTYLKNDYLGNNELYKQIKKLDNEALINNNNIEKINNEIINLLKKK